MAYGLGFRVLGFRVLGSRGFRLLGFRVLGSYGIGFMAYGMEFHLSHSLNKMSGFPLITSILVPCTIPYTTSFKILAHLRNITASKGTTQLHPPVLDSALLPRTGTKTG